MESGISKVEPMASTKSRFCLHVFTAGHDEERFSLNNGEYVLGRVSSNVRDRVILGWITINDPTVSRRHCIINVNDNDVIIADASSRNGTFVNGKRITGSAIPLQTSDRIELGNSLLFLEPN